MYASAFKNSVPFSIILVCYLDIKKYYYFALSTCTIVFTF